MDSYQGYHIKNKSLLESTNGKIITIKKYPNDRYGGIFENGQFRWLVYDKTDVITDDHSKLQESCKNSIDEGGVSVDLKTAVNLLRKYYFEEEN